MAIEKSDQHAAANGKTVKTLLQLTKEYSKWLTEEETKTADELVLMNVRRHAHSDPVYLFGHPSSTCFILTMFIDAFSCSSCARM
jgi:hypothetical protein